MRAGNVYEQRDQPEGVPPLALTGERTLPDVPEENYWFRRHLVVYEWIAARTAGQRVIDMACGEGYGSDVLAQSAASVIGVDANPDAFEHARLRYQRATDRGLSVSGVVARVFLVNLELVALAAAAVVAPSCGIQLAALALLLIFLIQCLWFVARVPITSLEASYIEDGLVQLEHLPNSASPERSPLVPLLAAVPIKLLGRAVKA